MEKITTLPEYIKNLETRVYSNFNVFDKKHNDIRTENPSLFQKFIENITTIPFESLDIEKLLINITSTSTSEGFDIHIDTITKICQACIIQNNTCSAGDLDICISTILEYEKSDVLNNIHSKPDTIKKQSILKTTITSIKSIGRIPTSAAW